ncbi:unnamed protein product, partial [Ectocarpus sp. 12 AP-2014]
LWGGLVYQLVDDIANSPESVDARRVAGCLRTPSRTPTGIRTPPPFTPLGFFSSAFSAADTSLPASSWSVTIKRGGERRRPHQTRLKKTSSRLRWGLSNPC